MKWTTYIALLFLVVALAGCSSRIGDGPDDTIVVTVQGAHSGSQAPYGLSAIDAVKMVAADYNARGGIHDMLIEVATYDDQCRPDRAERVVEMLDEKESYFIIGPSCSRAARAVLSRLPADRAVVISPAARQEDLRKQTGYRHFYRTIGTDEAQAVVQAEFLKEQGVKTLVLAHDESDYGRNMAELFETIAPEYGFFILPKVQIATETGARAFARRADSLSADYIVYQGHSDMFIPFARETAKLMNKTPILGGDGIDSPVVREMSFSGTRNRVYASSPKPLRSIGTLGDELKQAMGKDIGPFYYRAYIAALALFQAMERSEDMTVVEISEILQNSTFSTPDYPLKFSFNGDRYPLDVFEVKAVR